VTGCFIAAGQVLPSAWWAGAVTGFYTMAIITINEVPDYDADRRAGKKNLVVRFGRARGLQLWAAFLYLSFASLAAAIFLGGLPRQTLLALLVLPRLVRLVDRAPAALDDLPTLIDLCGTTIKTELLLWALLVAGVAATAWFGVAA
jgi:1,4-dihydroxy-2-naphthoate octaprenyltransferase